MTKTYECIAVDINTQDCTNWQVSEHSLPMAKPDVDLITAKIIGFMIFVFIIKQIKKSVF